MRSLAHARMLVGIKKRVPFAETEQSWVNTAILRSGDGGRGEGSSNAERITTKHVDIRITTQ